LSAPRKYRQQQCLCKKMLLSEFPNMFSLPTKGNFGLPLDAAGWRVGGRRRLHQFRSVVRRLGVPINEKSPMANYIHFSTALRETKILRELIRSCLDSLSSRGVVKWLNIDRLWQMHDERRADFSAALMLLASLELNIRSGV